MTEQITRLNDVFPDWLTGGGIFSELQTLSVPWAGENIASPLDREYHGNVAGRRIISPLVDNLLTDGVLFPARKTALANIITSIYGAPWAKQWETMELDYNPIENYSMTEQMTNDQTVANYGRKNTRNVDSKINGFNTSEGVPANSGDEVSEDSGSDSQTRNYLLTRKGNIGVTTSQQMIQSERDLWKWNFFRDVVFPDVNRVLTIQSY